MKVLIGKMYIQIIEYQRRDREMSGTKIINCDCKNAFQDETYGKVKRVHNYAAKANGGNGGWRYTVCLKIKNK